MHCVLSKGLNSYMRRLSISVSKGDLKRLFSDNSNSPRAAMALSIPSFLHISFPYIALGTWS